MFVVVGYETVKVKSPATIMQVTLFSVILKNSSTTGGPVVVVAAGVVEVVGDVVAGVVVGGLVAGVVVAGVVVGGRGVVSSLVQYPVKCENLVTAGNTYSQCDIFSHKI